MALDHPLRFQPIFRRYLWGGRRLATVLNKPIGEGDDYAESWEVVDRPADQSVVRFGPLAGRTLHELVAGHAHELFGETPLAARFPLLLKFLDAHRDLSVQVHPDDEQAARLAVPDAGKTEAWIVLHADPGSVVYAGWAHAPLDRSAVEQAIAEGNVVALLHKLEPRVGDCLFIPAGTPHAIGAGLVVAEIQQASDTTFRLFDWNRLGSDGRPRPLHVAEALDVLDYERGPVEPRRGEPTERPFVSRLVACDKFVVDRWSLRQGHLLGGDGRFHLLAVTRGAAALRGDPAATPLASGQTALLPAAAGAVEITPQGEAELIDMYLA